jgi:hypothetical protein
LDAREKEISSEQRELCETELNMILETFHKVMSNAKMNPLNPDDLAKALRSLNLTQQQVFDIISLNTRSCMEGAWVHRCEDLIKKHPAYPFLKNVKSCGPILSAILMAQLDPLKINYVSSFYAFCGCVKGHDRLVKGEKATFNKWLKAKVLGVLAGNFIKQRSEYALYFYNRTIFLMNKENAEISAGEVVSYFGKLKPEDEAAGKRARKTAMHIMMMARRHMMQKFLRDYYCASRYLMGMPIIKAYEDEKLGLHHSAEDDLTSWKRTIDFGNDKKALSDYRAEVKARCEEMTETVKELQEKYGYKSASAKNAEEKEADIDEDEE